MNILVIEDEAAIREVETAYLREAGYDVAEAADGDNALAQFESGHFDLVILDLNLPGQDGLSVCRRLRAASPVPILMVTARTSEAQELSGLDAGADDYIKKPFQPAVLVARVRALLRRAGNGAGEPLRRGDLTLDPASLTATRAGQPVSLTVTQFNLLYTLASEPGRVFTREQLLDRAYTDPDEHLVYDRTIDAHIKNLRRALGDTGATCIQTVIGRGYRFNPEASHV